MKNIFSIEYMTLTMRNTAKIYKERNSFKNSKYIPHRRFFHLHA